MSIPTFPESELSQVEVPHFDWAGDAREMGRQHGEALRSEIGDLLAYVQEVYGRRSGMSNRWKTEYLRFVSSFHATGLSGLDDLNCELEGIADGSGVDVNDIIILNCFLDALNRFRPRGTDSPGCTTIAISEGSAGAGPFIAQNIDIWKGFGKHLVTACMHPKQGPRVLVVTFPGILGCVGINSAGLGVGINFLQASDARPGMALPILVRMALTEERIGDAIGSLVVAPRASGMHYALANSGGLIASLEVTAKEHSLRILHRGAVCHANHYLAPSLKEYDGLIGAGRPLSATRAGSSLLRYHLSETLVSEAKSGVSSDFLFTVLRNHENWPYSICFHGTDSLAEVLTSTSVASVVMDPSNGVIELRRGSAHSKRTHLVSLN